MKNTFLLLALLLGLLAACSDEVTTTFNDLSQAKRENAFKRGWLPPLLPSTSRNIIETNDLDADIGDGSFEYDLAERSQYIDKLIRDYSGQLENSNGETTITMILENTKWSIHLPMTLPKATYRVESK